jgi:hypothetical protein
MAWLELKEIKPGNHYWYLRVPFQGCVRSVYLGKNPSRDRIEQAIARFTLPSQPAQTQRGSLQSH